MVSPKTLLRAILDVILILSGGGDVLILIYLFSSIHAGEGYRILGTFIHV